jgi:hypothetical protein
MGDSPLIVGYKNLHTLNEGIKNILMSII